MDADPAQRLEHHLAKEFVSGYINRALRGARAVEIDPNRIYMAARFQGLRVSTGTLAKVLEEYRRKPT
jgi:hypothetical protein